MSGTERYQTLKYKISKWVKGYNEAYNYLNKGYTIHCIMFRIGFKCK